MAVITVSGRIGQVFFVPANPKKEKEAVLNVGIMERGFKNNHPTTKWYQACWTGHDAERLHKIMEKVKYLTVIGDEDFRIRKSSEKIELERVVWVLRETPHWKEKDQIEIKI